MPKEFNLDQFIRQVENTDSLNDQVIDQRQRTLKAFDLVICSRHVTPDILTACTHDDLEWALDLVMYWPTYEIELEKDDLSHEGVQHTQILSLIRDLSKWKSTKQKVVFI